MQMSKCALHLTFSGSPSNRRGFSIKYWRVDTKMEHYGAHSVPMKLRNGRQIWIMFQVCDADGPIMSVGKFVRRRTTDAPRSRHEVVSCGTKKLVKCWWTEFETITTCNAGSNEETCWHQLKLVTQVEARVNLRDFCCSTPTSRR